MIKIDFPEPNSQEWIEWKELCQSEQQNLNQAMESGQNLKIKAPVYKGNRFNIKFGVYINLEGPFSGKCAYCETDILSNQPGDMEHYRPKAAVKDEHDKSVKVIVDGQLQDHPGYYWIAYDWKNLLPACRDCNSRTKQKTRGEWIGKGNQFPVKGTNAVIPFEQVQEAPLILNPVVTDPKPHLFIDRNGLFNSGTEEGIITIKIFGLNVREGLVTARKDTYDNAALLMKTYLVQMIYPGKELEVLYRNIEKIKNGKKPYTNAALKAFRDVLAEQIKNISNLTDSVI